MEPFGRMGLVKEKYMKDERRGFTLINKVICRNCLNNEDLRKFAYSYRSTGICDYCGKKYNTIVSVDRMVEESILPGINIVYGNPAECNEYYDGEYRGDCFLTNEVIETL